MSPPANVLSDPATQEKSPVAIDQVYRTGDLVQDRPQALRFHAALAPRGHAVRLRFRERHSFQSKSPPPRTGQSVLPSLFHCLIKINGLEGQGGATALWRFRLLEALTLHGAIFDLSAGPFKKSKAPIGLGRGTDRGLGRLALKGQVLGAALASPPKRVTELPPHRRVRDGTQTQLSGESASFVMSGLTTRGNLSSQVGSSSALQFEGSLS